MHRRHRRAGRPAGPPLEVVSVNILMLSGRNARGTGAIVQAASGRYSRSSVGTVDDGRHVARAAGAGSWIDIVGIVNGGTAEVVMGYCLIKIVGLGSESIRSLSGIGGLEVASIRGAHMSVFAPGRSSQLGGSLK